MRRNDIHELKDTIPMMDNPNYKERFKAEYYQLVIRVEKLESMLKNWKAGKLIFNPSCPYELLKAQVDSMNIYKYILEQRAAIEGVKL